MTRPGLAWRQYFPHPTQPERETAVLRAWAADQRSPFIVLEARATAGAVRYLLGTRPEALDSVVGVLRGHFPDVPVTELADKRSPVQTVAGLRATTRHRALRTQAREVESSIRSVLSALCRAEDDEELVLQLVLGPRRVPLFVPNQSPSSVVSPWYQIAWRGNGGQLDGAKRAALREKVGDHGFAAALRIGVRAGTAARGQSLILGVLAALRTSESSGLQLRLAHDNATRMHAGSIGWRWPLRLNVAEAATLTAWPLSDDELPGQPPLHPKVVAPAQLAEAGDRIIANTNAPGVSGQLAYSVTDSLRHTWALGPNGTGKTTLLANLISQDLRANRPVVVIEPKDLVRDVLKIIPEHRRDQVVLLDATDDSPVGINPLQRHGRRPELVADSLLGTFQALYGEGLGPRSTDILSNALSVLARRDDASLVMLPLLLSNPGFRRSLTAKAIHDDPIAAGPFWAWFESLTDDARSQAIAPLSNKLRPILRPQLRAVLGQRKPRFNIRQVLSEKKILLVPLQAGVLGPDAAQLLGALVVSELWLALRERVAIPEAERDPVMIFLDEVQTFLKLPTDLSDALATSRSLRGAWHLAHQYRDQLSPSMRAAFEANARSRICFQLNATDARAMAAGQSVVAPEDFSSLPAFHVYAQLMRGNSLQLWASGVTLPPPEPCSDPDDIRARSRAQYGQPLNEIEAGFSELLTGPLSAEADVRGQTGRRPRRQAKTVEGEA